MKEYTLPFEKITKKDLPKVGGKNANLGEMLNKAKIPVPTGFAVTAEAYQHFIRSNNLWPRIQKELDKIKNPNDTRTLKAVGKKIRTMILEARMPEDLKESIEKAYETLSKKEGIKKAYVSVRSSATAEDLPGASFAGQQETYLNVVGGKNVVKKVQECYASLFTDRAIFYRIQKGFDHSKVHLSAGVQLMVDSLCSGVMFTLDVRNGDTTKVLIEGAWGLGEYIVQGKVTPDDYFVDKKTMRIIEKSIPEKRIMLVRKKGGGVIQKKVPKSMVKKQVLSDAQVKELAKYGIKLEKHYKQAQDIEWAVDRQTNQLMILQSRPETVWSLKKARAEGTVAGKIILKGLSASPGIGAGKVKIIHSAKEIKKIRKGDILVTWMTSPDMVPAMRKASAIITDSGGMTSHAAIVSRELGIPCIVGTGNATKVLKEEQKVTVDGGKGLVLEGILKSHKEKKHEEPVPKTKTKVYVNLGVPEIAKEIAKKPADGVGLMREEFILATYVKEHPLSLIEKGEEKLFVDRLSKGVSMVAKAFYPRPVVLRLSDFKTNEYRELKGGGKYEPAEENPMLGWRGCSRYISPEYEPAFRLELKAVKKVLRRWKNVHIMLPFPRTVEEVKKVKEIMEEEGLKPGKDFKLWLMAEVPSNIFLADKFADLCDGFSIGSNDLTQLILGVDRDSQILGKMGLFDERNEAVKRAIKHLIKEAHKKGKTVSICGQAPSNYPEFTEFLVKHGIDSVSVNPDAVEKTKRIISRTEKGLKKHA